MANGDLCTLADLKGWLNIGTGATADDALLARLLTSTSADFLNEIDRYDFFAADFVDVKRGRSLVEGPRRAPSYLLSAGRSLVLRHWPINTIASVVLDAVTVPVSPDGLASGYYLDANTDPENRQVLTLIDYMFTQWSSATISYNAGYATAPLDVAQAVIEWTAARYRQRTTGGMSSLHLTEGRSQTESAAYVPWDMPKSTQRVAERYKTNNLAMMFGDYD